jgi:hypothetical protein
MSGFRHTARGLLLALLSPVAWGESNLQVEPLTPLPEATSNNAVASVVSGDREYVISFNGLASGKTHADTHAKTFVLDTSTGLWHKAPPVPGGDGRLAAAAATVGDLAYVFGGYSVAADGSEASTPWVHAFDPVARSFAERSAMPVPVDDAIALAFGNRYIYLVSGWHDLANVNLTQLYDTVTDSWTQATPIPGSSVFGHAGGIVGNRIVYCDGVRIRAHPDKQRDYVATDECYLGIIDAEAPRTIDWRTIDKHPGPPRYRAAAAGIESLGGVLFVGGTDNPYNYNGIGYNGVPSEPQPGGVLFDVQSLTWQNVTQDTEPTMDHRALVPLQDRWLTVGGMTSGQQVTHQVRAYRLLTTGE